jgi:purine nucleoside permease
MRKIVRMVAVSVLLVLVLSPLAAQGVTEKQEIKVLVLGMFEVGENKGDFAGEFQHFYEEYLDGAPAYTLNEMPLTLYVNDNGVAGAIAGMGKAQASATLTTILRDGRFDFSNTYIVISGCAGMAPERGTLGDVVIADALVDVELGHAWKESDNPADSPTMFLRSSGYDRAGYIPLNKGLANWAFELTKDVELFDDRAAATYRMNYGPQEATEKPSVQMGVSVTGDNYWHGKASSQHADVVTAAYNGGTYMVTQMEDNAFGVVALNEGKLDRLIVVRDVVNYDQPYPGQTVLESLDASSGAFAIGMKNGFIVSKTIIDTLVDNWDLYKEEIPSL